MLVVAFGCSVYDRALLDDAREQANAGTSAGASAGASASAGSASAGASFGGADAGGGAGAAGVGGGASGTGSGAGKSSAGGRGGAGPSSGGAGSSAAGTSNEGGAAGDDTGGAGAAGEAGCDAPVGCACDESLSACEALVGSLVHRYTFSGTGAVVEDERGSLDGALVGTGALLDGDGALVLPGGGSELSDPQAYVELPATCLDGLTDATLELWFSWEASGAAWQRLFDFGQPAAELTGTTLWFSPQAPNTDTGTSRAAFGTTGYTDEIQVIGPALPAGSYAVAVVFDDAAGMLSLFVDGAFQGAQALPNSLDDLVTEHCWLGRSSFADDPYFGGTLEEFRIYGAALSAPDLAFSHAAGPNPPFL